MKKLFTICSILLCIAVAAQSEIRHVPDDYETIQAGIGAADEGDTVLVAPGEYREYISFEGKDIAVIGSPEDPALTVINCGTNSNVVTFNSGESADAKLSGFTITNGSATSGGGISCVMSNPTLTDLIISDNSALEGGGGLYILRSQNITLRNIHFYRNEAETGGGIDLTFSTVQLENCTFSQNEAGRLGGAVLAKGCPRVEMKYILVNNSIFYWPDAISVYMEDVEDLRISNVTLVNTTQDVYTGLHIASVNQDVRSQISNSIFWGHRYDVAISSELNLNNTNNFTITYSDLRQDHILRSGNNCNFEFGDGMLNINPMFTDPEHGDFHLNQNSPCIDAGDPNSLRDPDSTRADIGAYYFDQSNESVDSDFILHPSSFTLYSYPNPFNSSMTIHYSIPHAGQVNLSIYDITGKLVETLMQGNVKTGNYSVVWDAQRFASGIYFVKLKEKNELHISKIILVR